MKQRGGDPRRITLHRPEDFEGMRRAGRLAAETLDMVAPHVRPGVTTAELDRLCHDFMVGRGAVPAPLGYRGYTNSRLEDPRVAQGARSRWLPYHYKKKRT